MKQIKNFIANMWCSGESSIDVHNPASGEVIACVAAATEADVMRALEGAESAAKIYGEYSINQRKALIDALTVQLKTHESEITDLLIQETGKTREIASYDFNMLVDCLGYYI